MTYAYKHFAFNDSNNLVCIKKSGDLTFMSIGRSNSFSGNEKKYLPIILFDDYPQAVQATLVVEPRAIIDGALYQKSYTVTADRKTDGYFLFRLNWPEQVIWDNADDSYMDDWRLTDLLRQQLNGAYWGTSSVPCNIKLYDKDGQLILEREIDLAKPHPQ